MAVSETLALDVRQALNSIGQVDKALTDAAVGFEGALNEAAGAVDVEVDSSSVDQATESVDKLNQQLDEEASKQDKAALSAKKHDEAMSKVGTTALIAGAALAAGFALAISATLEFDRSMSLVKAVTNASGKEFDKLRQAAIDAGAATIFSASEAADAEGELAKAGVKTSDILGGALTGSLNLAAAGSLGLEEAATIAAQAMTAFGLSGKDVTHIADVLAAGANKGVSSVSSLGEALGSVGPLALQFKLGIEETTGVLALFEQNGIRGSEAGTSLRRVLLQLVAPSKEAAGVMKQYGIDVFNTQGEFIGMSGAAETLRRHLGPLTDETRQAALATIFGSFAVQGANVLYRNGAAGIDAWTAAVNDQGAAARFSSVALDNLAGDVEQLKGSFETALIQGGSQATSVLRGLTQTATEALNNFAAMPGAVQGGVVAFAGLGSTLLLTVGTFATIIPKFHAARDALIEMGGFAEFAGKNLGKMVQLGSGLAAVAAGITLIGTSAVGTAAGIGAMVAGGAQLGAAFGHPAIGAAVGLFAGITTELLHGGESAEKFAANIAKLGSEIDQLGKKQAVKKFGEQFAHDVLEGNVSSLNEELKKLAIASPTAAQTVVDGFVAMGKSSGFTKKELEVLQGVVDKGAATYKRHAENAAAAAKANADLVSPLVDVGAAAAEAEPDVSGIADAFKDADDAASNFDTVLSHIFGIFISAEKADLAFNKALTNLTKTIKENGNTLDATTGELETNTEKGQANADAMIAVADAALAVAQAQLREGKSVHDTSIILGAHVQALVDTAEQAGLSGQAALNYAAKLLGIPPERFTDIHNSADLARVAAETLESTYNRLDGRVVNTKIEITGDVIQMLQSAGFLSGGGQVLPAARGRGVLASGSYWVGEQGPELFRPTTPGRIISHPESMATAQSAPPHPTSTAGPLIGTLIVQAPTPDPVAVGYEAARRLRAEMYLRRA